MDQRLGSPPSVAGWEAYYLAPIYHRKWIDSATFPVRQEFISKILNTRAYTHGGVAVTVHPNWTSLLKLNNSKTTGIDVIRLLSEFMFIKPLPNATLIELGAIYDNLKVDDPMITPEYLLLEAIKALTLMPEYQLG
jgi:hypothetical protein